MPDERASGAGRLLTGMAWSALLVALWLWGRDVTEVPMAVSPTTGDVAAAGRPGHALPPAHDPLPPARPGALTITTANIRAPIEPHGLTRQGAVEPPPFTRPGAVAWYQGGPAPGSPGAAVLVGHLDTDRAPAVFSALGDLGPGEKIGVTRADGSTAEFTVEDVAVFTKDRFDAAKAYGPRRPDRAELRLITCGGNYDRERRSYSANIVVSAYLTDTTAPFATTDIRKA
ncbi:class F sortase [Streptomyces triculaminicus]|uniref:Class F sortase n=1 Tax=Streptomyces triculaminicus TaxID=2816232 RepID=A0A939FI88_9ACTN|nr:class F sortase [Streptomyces triculaminicus]MBO0651564.1 class F sortase [Streptomyces triculaminicus]